MSLLANKTRIVATIGPASDSPEMLERLIHAGMDIARLNFSHGSFEEQGARITRIRHAEQTTGRSVAILADLPGPKMRIGKIAPEPITLAPGNTFTLTTEKIIGNADRVSMSFERLPRVVKRGDAISLNDGLVQLAVGEVSGAEVRCKVVVGGELRSNKGLNIPGVDLGISAFTEHDRACLEFALRQGVDAVGQSFVETADDVRALREAAGAFKRQVFVIAKIERSRAVRNVEEILKAADGIMVARGDLGVEMPIEEVAILQKQLIAKASVFAKPVITATQMLESMTASRLPTRAEASDVANAILDGTDCVMLSAESAIGKFPAEAVGMLSRIAARVEAFRACSRGDSPEDLKGKPRPSSPVEAISDVVEHALQTLPYAAVFVPTRSGTTARTISRYNPDVWIVAVTHDPAVSRALSFSYGVHPVLIDKEPENWKTFAAEWLEANHVPGNSAVLVAGPSLLSPKANHRIEFLLLKNPG